MPVDPVLNRPGAKAQSPHPPNIIWAWDVSIQSVIVDAPENFWLEKPSASLRGRVVGWLCVSALKKALLGSKLIERIDAVLTRFARRFRRNQQMLSQRA